MRLERAITVQCLALALLALCAAVSAQNTVTSTQAPASSNAPTSSGSVTNAPSSSGSAAPSGTGSRNSTISGTMSSNSTNATSSSTSTTPTTFPIASVPSTGYLAGTAAAPVPGGASGAMGTAATGPNDSHIVSAAQVLRASFAAISASILAIGAGVWLLL